MSFGDFVKAEIEFNRIHGEMEVLLDSVLEAEMEYTNNMKKLSDKEGNCQDLNKVRPTEMIASEYFQDDEEACEEHKKKFNPKCIECLKRAVLDVSGRRNNCKRKNEEDIVDYSLESMLKKSKLQRDTSQIQNTEVSRLVKLAQMKSGIYDVYFTSRKPILLSTSVIYFTGMVFQHLVTSPLCDSKLIDGLKGLLKAEYCKDYLITSTEQVYIYIYYTIYDLLEQMTFISEKRYPERLAFFNKHLDYIVLQVSCRLALFVMYNSRV